MSVHPITLPFCNPRPLCLPLGPLGTFYGDDEYDDADGYDDELMIVPETRRQGVTLWHPQSTVDPSVTSATWQFSLLSTAREKDADDHVKDGDDDGDE